MNESGMRMHCGNGSCFKDEHQLRFQTLTERLPGKFGMSDIDGVMERYGFLLFQEWKHGKQYFNKAQAIMFANLSRLVRQSDDILLGDKATQAVRCLDVVGKPQTMEVSAIRIWKDGHVGEWQDANLNQLQNYVLKFYEWATLNGSPRAR